MRNLWISAAVGLVAGVMLLLVGWRLLVAFHPLAPAPVATASTSAAQQSDAPPPPAGAQPPDPNAQAMLAPLLQRESLGQPLAAFEAKYGQPLHVVTYDNGSDMRDYLVGGCKVSVQFDDHRVISGLGLHISRGCTFDPNNLLGRTDLPSADALTFGVLARAMPGAVFHADCISVGCGPEPHTFFMQWDSDPANVGFSVLASREIVDLVDSSSADAAINLVGQMTAAKGPDYVRNRYFNCDQQFNAQAISALSDVHIDYIQLQRGPSQSWCNKPG